MNILITGASGFVGSHLIDSLLATGKRVIWGLTRQHKNIPRGRESDIHWVVGDLADQSFLQDTLSEIKPAEIYHLAGQARVAHSWESPDETMTANVLGQIHLFEALRKLAIKPAILAACSSEEYGWLEPHELPVREESPLRPLSPYAVSKAAQDLMAYQYFRSYNFHTLRTRAFNHTGPRRPDCYAVSSFCKQLALIEAHRAEPVMHVGNLKAKRDYLDVRDTVRAYRLVVEKGNPGEVYNICSGHARSMEDILQMLLRLCPKQVRIEQDPARLRPSDLPIIYGDAGKLRKATGWEPQISFEQTLKDLLAYWREQIAADLPAASKGTPVPR